MKLIDGYTLKNLSRKFFPKNGWTLFPFLFSILIVLGLMLTSFFTASDQELNGGYKLLFNMPLYISAGIIPINFIWLGIKINHIRYHTYNNFNRSELFIFSAFISIVWSVIILLLIFGFAAAILNKNVFLLQSILYGQLIYAYLMLVLTIYGLTMFFAIVFKSAKILSIFYVVFISYALFVSGQIIPYEIFNDLNIISYFALVSPLNYPLSLINNTLMISDYVSVLKTNPNYFSTAAYLEGLNNMGVNIFSNTDFIISLTPDKPNKILQVYSSWNKILNLTVPYLVTVLGILISYSLYYYMAIPNSIYEIFIGSHPQIEPAPTKVHQEPLPMPLPEVVEQVVEEETAPAIETHPANTTWEEDGNYYYHDGQGNYYQADPTGTQWISIPPRV